MFTCRSVFSEIDMYFFGQKYSKLHDMYEKEENRRKNFMKNLVRIFILRIEIEEDF